MIFKFLWKKEKNPMNQVTEASRNFVQELNDAERKANSTETAVRLAHAAVRKEENLIAGARRDISAEIGNRDVQENIIATAQTNLRIRKSDLVKAEAEAGLEKTALKHIQCEIKNHPLRLTAVEKQKALCAKAAELAKRAWHEATILELDKIKTEIEKLADEEFEFVNRENNTLREAQLPLLRPRIADECMNMLPAFVWDYALDHIANDAAAVRSRIVEF